MTSRSVVAVLGLALLAACGGGDHETDTGAVAPPPTSAPVATDGGAADPTSTTVGATALDCAALLTPDEFATIIGRPQEDSNGTAQICNYGADDFNTPYSIGVFVAPADHCSVDEASADGTIEGLGDRAFYIDGAGGAAGVHVLVGDRCVSVASGIGTAGDGSNVRYDVHIPNSEAAARVIVPRLG